MLDIQTIRTHNWREHQSSSRDNLEVGIGDVRNHSRSRLVGRRYSARHGVRHVRLCVPARSFNDLSCLCEERAWHRETHALHRNKELLLDHPVGASKQLRSWCNPKRFRSFEIDD